MIVSQTEKPEEEKVRHFELCLDFANTLSWHASANPHENLHTYGELLAWALKRGLLDNPQAERLRAQSEREEVQAEATRRWAIRLREAIYRIFAAQVHKHKTDPTDLELLNGAWGAFAPKARIDQSGGGYRWGWVQDDDLDRMLWPIVRSAGDLLTNEALLERVGQCADDRGCGWLFLDLSKNHSRRWCDINDCGNRAKQRRYQQRLREEKR